MTVDIIETDKKTFPLWAQMLSGMALGVLAGLALGSAGIFPLPEEMLQPLTEWVMLPARIFIALITMIVIPLVFCSILLAVTGSGGFSFLKKTGLRVALYFVATTTIAVCLGYGLHAAIDPAQYVPPEWFAAETQDARATAAEVLAAQAGGDSIPQLIAGLIPGNPAAVVLKQQMLQIVIAALMAGLALMAMPAKDAAPVNALCQSVQGICMKVVGWAMVIAPVAVFGFLFSLTVTMGMDMLRVLSWYVATVLSGLVALMAMYLLLVTFVARRDPWAFLRGIRDPQILAFSSSSSAATMPLSMATAEQKLGVKPEVARFVIPLGATVNMDGTALYQMIVAMFLTRLMGIDLSMTETILLSITIIGASIGSPGSPGVGLVILSTILMGLGIPEAAIGIVLGVDRFLDMCRTTVNVTGDLTASVIADRWARGKNTTQ